MIEIRDKSMCSGCTACMNICPKKAIDMKEDEKGFKYPIIDEKKCINCGLCSRLCPILNTKKNISLNKCYVGYSKNPNDRMNSSSGALFSILANYILNNNGIVVGAAFDKSNNLKHIAVKSKKNLEPLRKSKYLQSDLGNIFTYIKEELKTKKILFVGTPCQVAGLKAFIKNNDNLLTVDLFCHGVPSTKLFTKYIKELEENNNDKLLKYDFRDNSTGWDTYSNKAIFKKKEIKTLSSNNKYMKLFLSDIALRESCYNCNFKLGNKYSDITLGDFWGIKSIFPEMYNKEGVSAIIVNTELGNKIFNLINGSLEYKECNLQDILLGNPSLQKSSILPKNREKFFNDINKYDMNYLCNKYVKKSSLIKKVKNKIKKLLKK